jgi:hypothetical protein
MMQAPAGSLVVVPIEPTVAMVSAADDENTRASKDSGMSAGIYDLYMAMVAARPGIGGGNG